ncbi:MAG: DUF1007 family protein [Deltaproteobacteria bacterium]|nr:DUF1007 family protein [Deltaproteobacteria bacterium]
MLKRTVYRVFCLISLFVCFISAGVCTSYAHPHVFIDSWITVVFDKKGLAGFNIRWAFDDMFSSMIIMDFDTNHNRRFEAAEIREIEELAFSYLREFEYFVHVKIGKKPFHVKYVKNFSAKIKDNRVFYSFFIPCHVRATEQWKEVRISVYDQKYYTDILPGKAPLKFKDQGSFEVRHRFSQNKSEAYFFDQIYPYEAVVRFRLKNG